MPKVCWCQRTRASQAYIDSQTHAQGEPLAYAKEHLAALASLSGADAGDIVQEARKCSGVFLKWCKQCVPLLSCPVEARTRMRTS